MSLEHNLNTQGIFQVSGIQSVFPGSVASASHWEVVRNANTVAPAQTNSVKHWEWGLGTGMGGASNLCFNPPHPGHWYTLMFESYCLKP